MMMIMMMMMMMEKKEKKKNLCVQIREVPERKHQQHEIAGASRLEWRVEASTDLYVSSEGRAQSEGWGRGAEVSRGRYWGRMVEATC